MSDSVTNQIGKPGVNRFIEMITKEIKKKEETKREELDNQIIKDIFNDEIYGHEHRFDIPTGSVESTCTSEGSVTYECRCGEQHTESVPMKDHIPETIRTESTCIDAGSIVVRCTVCNNVLSNTPIAATGHSYTSKVTTAATCIAEGVKTYTCSKCGATYTEPVQMIAHTYGSNDKCIACGLLNPAHVHSYTVISNTTTCNKAGVKTSICRCGDTKIEECQPEGHVFASEDMGTKCSVCGDEKTFRLSGFSAPVSPEYVSSEDSSINSHSTITMEQIFPYSESRWNQGDPITFNFYINDKFPESNRFKHWKYGGTYKMTRVDITVEGGEKVISKTIDVEAGEREISITIDTVKGKTIQGIYNEIIEKGSV